MQEAVKFQQVSKIFNAGSKNEFVALKDISLDIAENEFFTLLGPSGCGKTTLLRILAGFEQVSSGQLEVFGEEVAHLPPNKRSINTVFQHYALFPHLSVRENIAFGLQRLGKSTAEQDQVIEEMLSLVHMKEFANRKPNQLSGGQKQRIALARALAPQPKVLLLDEPLSALDLKLRQAMRWELKALQRKTGITFVFVTHDQEEALAMSDRVAVISQGRVQQMGQPVDIYESPANRFVADFIGESNLIDANVESKSNDACVLSVHGQTISIDTDDAQDCQLGSDVTLSIRPERILLSHPDQANAQGALLGYVDSQVYLGNASEFRILVNEQAIVARAPKGGLRGNWDFNSGDKVAVAFEQGAVRVLTE